jgi:photosystem II stability/assembly factor-like uncharacterized protein
MITAVLSFRKALLSMLAVSCCTVMSAQTYSASQWAGLHYRNVGPYRGGRVTAVTGVASQPTTFYMATVGGGVWRTTDAGHTWSNLTDGQLSVGSMGAIEVSQSNPNIIYAGTGSSKIRSNVSIGRGIYKSVDAGKTWQFIGLRDAGQIATIRVNPANPDEVFVAVVGNPFKDNEDRGVFRTRDGGKTWTKVLYKSPVLGAADIEFQPGHPNVIFATLWHGLRKPWTIISGSPASEGAGIYKSTDSGDHWTKLGGGLPSDLFGRANVAISNAAPDRIYALIEAKPGGGLYRSDDAGVTWTLVNGQSRIITRPFYYDTLGVDPAKPDTVWLGDESWLRSLDGGKTFKSMPEPHGDNHDLWINPKDSRYMIEANDGGAIVSLDGGLTWSTQENQSTAEIYQVALDNQFPYRIYGAQQDNTTVIVPSLPLGNGQEFREGPGCETGPIIPKLDDPNIVWGGCKGQFSRLNLTSNNNEQRYWIGSESLYGNEPPALRERFQRVAPMEISPFDPNVVYYGSQYIHRTHDGGVTWQTVSPDLTAKPGGTQYGSGEPITRDATGEEMYSVIYAIRESPKKAGVIWSGSNDGLVYVTQDDGKTWQNVTPNDLESGGRVQNIEPGNFAPGTAYVAIYRYLLGDFAPYLYRTDDFGKTWTKLTDGHNGIAVDEPTRVVREDPSNRNILYAGTEFGMYISFNRGSIWQPFQQNLPVVAITDIKLAHNDLVLSTQGRGFWILDNLSSLRQLTPSMDQPVLYKPATAIRIPSGGDHGRGPGAGAEYPLVGAQIDYALPSDIEGPVTLNVMDAAGKTIRSFTSVAPPKSTRADDSSGGGGEDEEGRFRPTYPATLDAKPGMHRFIWDLRYGGAPSATAPEPGTRPMTGPVAAPGTYSVVLSAGSFTSKQPLVVEEDPRVFKDGVTNADLVFQLEHNLRVLTLVNDTNRLVMRLTAAQTRFKADPEKTKALQPLADKLLTPKIRYSQPGLQTHVTYLYSQTNSTDQKVGRDAVERYAELRKKIDELTADFNHIAGESK